MYSKAERLKNSIEQEKTVAVHFTKFIKSNANIKKFIINDLAKFGKKFLEEDFNRLVITSANDKNVYAVDLAGFIDGQLIFQVEVKTITFNKSCPWMRKYPIIPITAETGSFRENGLVNFYHKCQDQKIPLYIIVYDEHARLSNKKIDNYFYFYNAETTQKFIDVINVFFAHARFNPTETYEELVKEVIKWCNMPVNGSNPIFSKWESGAISFFPSNCGIEPDINFS
jgi:hypothetical protein